MEERHAPPYTPVVPDQDSKLSKKSQVADMFDRIAVQYDFLNHLLSLGIDRRWRKRAIKELARSQPRNLLDLATGTGDLALEAARIPSLEHILGLDISEGMLELGREKIRKKGWEHRLRLEKGDGENIPYPDHHFDAVSCAYGVRNFEDLEKGISEMYRVLRPQGKLVILEFSQPGKFPVKQGYLFYFKYILPAIGRLFSRHRSAYSYLPASVAAFPQGEAFCQMLRQSGFESVQAIPLSFGVTTLYLATRPEPPEALKR